MIIAIDPGASGGIAIESDSGGLQCLKMPQTPFDLLQVLQGLKNVAQGNVEAVVEKVGMHRQGNNASASCKFARHCGHIEMALLACGISFVEPTPQKWMKSLGALPKEKQARKNAIKDQMQRRYPDTKVTLWNADALAILEWRKATK